MLDRLTEVPWDTLHHAYGDASDVPPILIAVKDGDSSALDELFGNIWHQGTVWEATPAVVPFLIELLDADGVDKEKLLELLQLIARGMSECWAEPSRKAVAAGASVYLRLLIDQDEKVRAAAAHTLGSCRQAADEITPTLLKLISRDGSAVATASMIFAAGALGKVSEEQSRAWLADDRAAPRLAAALIAVRQSGQHIAPEIARAVADSAPGAIDALDVMGWRAPASDSLAFVIGELEDRWELQVHLLTEWMSHPAAAVRLEAVFAAEQPLHQWRPAVARLVPAFAQCLSDADREVRYWAAQHLAGSGAAARAAAAELWALLERESLEYKAPSAFALLALCKLQDPRAGKYLAQKLESIAPPGREGTDPVDFPDSLSAAIQVVGPWAMQCLDPLVRLIPVVAPGNNKISIIDAVGRYGEAASASIPAIRAELPRHPHISTRVLGDFGIHAKDALPDLRKMLDHKVTIVRVNAARALWRITGDAHAALPTLKNMIEAGDRYGASVALEVVADIGGPAAELGPLLPPLFGSENEWLSLRSAIAYWHLTHDTREVVSVLQKHVGCTPGGMEALRCLIQMGAAEQVAPVLRQAVSSQHRQVSSGSTDSWIDQDEAWVKLCTEALTSIETN